MFDDLIGLMLGDDKYEIIELLGIGGVGTVWIAHDRELMRRVAVKVIRPEHNWQPEAVDAFIKEALIIANLEHPRILGIYDLGTELHHGERLVYTVMRFASAGTLADRLESSGSMSFHEAGRILRQICQALDYAHRRRVIHLDLKPHNILFDDQDNVLVADFGLAQVIEASTHVKADTLVGTPGYMPPEQIFGSDAGPSSDVYALGITLSQMLTGRLPEWEWQDGADPILHLEESLPQNIQSVIGKATQYDRRRRYRFAGDFARDFALELSALSPSPVEEELRVLRPEGWSIAINIGPSIAFSPDGNLLAAGTGGNPCPIWIWEVASGREVQRLEMDASGDDTWSVGFSPDGRFLAVGGDAVRLWDLESGQEVRRLEGYTMAFSPDGRLLASACGNTIYLWDVATDREVQRLIEDDGRAVRTVAFSPDGQLLASGGSHNMVRLWEVASGREVQHLEGHKSAVNCVAFSPDGQLIASGGDDTTVRVWEVNSAREVLRLKGHTKTVWSVAFSPDGRLLASGSGGGEEHLSGSMRLWHVESGYQLNRLAWRKRTLVDELIVFGVAFSPDGRFLAAASVEDVRLWPLK